MATLHVNELTKKFKDTTAVDGITFQIEEGEIVGLLGPNGAGKSTTIEMILGLIKPTSGSITLFGKDIEKDREYILSRINYASAYIQFMSRVTVYENLFFFGKLYQIKDPDRKIRELAELLEVTDLLKRLFFKLSSGQRTRVALAKTLLNDPKFLLLDEPTASLDPDIALTVRGVLKHIHKERQVTMLYTSHNMAEVEEMCERIIFLQKGRIVAEGTPDELKRTVRDYYLDVFVLEEKADPLVEFIREQKWNHEVLGGHIRVKTNADDLPHVLRSISQRDFDIYDIDINKPDLEEVFLKIANNR